jgi:hypothetical protein
MVSMDIYVLATTQRTIYEMLFTPELKSTIFFYPSAFKNNSLGHMRCLSSCETREMQGIVRRSTRPAM